MTFELVATSDKQWTGVAVSSSHLFVNYPNRASSHSISVAQLQNNTAVAFPDQTWNNWKEDLNPSEHFICVQSIQIDKNNFLWVLDAANIQRHGEYQGVVADGAKLLKFNIESGTLEQAIIFKEPVITNRSYLNDVQIDESKNVAYITDSNEGALIVVDLNSGIQRTLFDRHPAAKSENKILTVEGNVYRNEKGEYPVVHADGIALNEDRSYLYWRPLTGENLYRISTTSLNDTAVTEQELIGQVEKMGLFPPSDGMVFGFYGELYLASIEENALRAYNHGNATRLIRQREDLKWPDSFSVSQDGYLYFTTSQIHIINPQEPYKLFKIQIRF